MSTRGLPGLMVVCVVGIAALMITGILVVSPPNSSPTPPTQPPPPPSSSPPCPRAVGLCIERTVARVIDGDTLDVEGGLRIRLVLVDAPELSEARGPEAKGYLSTVCSGKKALVDEDDWQIGGDPYGRVLAVVACAGTNANAAMIASGHADTYFTFCSASEFGSQAWTGCSSPPPPPPPPPPGNCDAAYPDVCIRPPPPDLDCADVPFRNFRVLAPDPHRFDGDGDGVGCES